MRDQTAPVGLKGSCSQTLSLIGLYKHGVHDILTDVEERVYPGNRETPGF